MKFSTPHYMQDKIHKKDQLVIIAIREKESSEKQWGPLKTEDFNKKTIFKKQKGTTDSKTNNN